MKKILPVLLLILITAAAGANENWLYTGFEYSRIFESVDTGGFGSKRDVSSFGLNISGFTFNNFSPGGFFFHSSFLFPQTMTLTADDEVIRLDRQDIVYNYLFSILLGPAIRTPSNNVVQAYGGIGLHASAFLVGMGSAYYDEYVAQKTYNVGIGLEAGAKINVTPSFYFTLGSTAIWDFYNYTDMMVNGYPVDVQFEKFRNFMIDPFLCIGFSWGS